MLFRFHFFLVSLSIKQNDLRTRLTLWGVCSIAGNVPSSSGLCCCYHPHINQSAVNGHFTCPAAAAGVAGMGFGFQQTGSNLLRCDGCSSHFQIEFKLG